MSPGVAVLAMEGTSVCRCLGDNVLCCCWDVYCWCIAGVIAGGCVGGCTSPGVCEDVAGGGCVSAVGYCKVDVDCDAP